jgi:hypothetical protein
MMWPPRAGTDPVFATIKAKAANNADIAKRNAVLTVGEDI